MDGHGQGSSTYFQARIAQAQAHIEMIFSRMPCHFDKTSQFNIFKVVCSVRSNPIKIDFVIC